MDQTIRFTVNGQQRRIRTDSERPLLEVLREDLNLTGTKYGCGDGQCRACTVLVDGRSVVSCTTPISELDRREVLTIEGLASNGELHAVQEAFLAEDAFQCGYCTPGMILSVVELLNETPPLDADAIIARLESHICRCCGYPRIRQAIQRAVANTRRNPQ